MCQPNDRGQGCTDETGSLLELAKRKLGTLSKADKKLFAAAATGNVADYSAETDEDNDPARADEWGGERVLEADRIVWLCTDAEASALVSHRGLWVQGARVDGRLALEFARIPFLLYFGKSALPAGINLQNAEVPAVNLRGTHTGPITADGLNVDGNVFLRGGFRAEGELRLLGATIEGSLECDGGQFINPDAKALSADRLKVGGSVFLIDKFRAEGEVRLLGATIGGNLQCDGGQFMNPGAHALNAERLKVEGSVFLGKGFSIEGEVRLLGATIGGNLECGGGHFINPHGHALSADRLKVGGSVFLTRGFRAEGEVRLLGATIGSDLACNGGQFIRPHGNALSADALEVRGNVFLRKGFEAKGVVSLVGVAINGYLVWTRVVSPELVTLDLRSARIGTLWDEKESWPQEGSLFLHGLEYGEIDDESPADAESRIDWLRRQPTDRFYPQPYEQLAEVLRKSGYDADARKILIAKAKDRARFGQLSFFGRPWHRLLGLTIGYGYWPWQALWFVLGIVILGWVLFAIGFRAGVMTPTKERTPRPNALVYSLDTFVPLVDLHQGSYWLPDAEKRGELRISEKLTLPVSGSLLRWYLWSHIVAGWVLTTLLAVGLSGLVRR